MKLLPVIEIKSMRNLALLVTLLFTVTCCKKNNAKAGNNVEMYLLGSYQLVPDKCQVDTSKAVLENLPLIKNEDILRYTRTSCQYELSGNAFYKVQHLTGRTPFAMTVDKRVIFYGVYMPWFLSSTCSNSITMSESQPSGISMNLGYPGMVAGVDIDDQRNHPALIAAFANQGKLR